jgi:hypothetical protein
MIGASRLSPQNPQPLAIRTRFIFDPLGQLRR